MTPGRFIFHRLSFTGPGMRTAELTFADGVNVVWGASNTGKTFVVKALDFMTGAGAALPDIRQRQGYDSVWLDVSLPKAGRLTLGRSTQGGGFAAYLGAHEIAPQGKPDFKLSANQKTKDSLSGYLLNELGVVNKTIATNQNGTKANLSFRHFAPYVFTEETDIIGDWSPIRLSDFASPTFDKGVLKFILTGLDDSAIITTESSKDRTTAKRAKIELLDELLNALISEFERDFPGEPDLADQDEKVSATIDHHEKAHAEYQDLLDRLRRERREGMDARSDAQERASEIVIALDRFAILKNVYDSDVQRLESLEEGGAALMAGVRRTCPLCGALPEDQRHAHGLEEVEKAQGAARAEIGKIKAEAADLSKATTSMQAELEGLVRRVERLTSDIKTRDEAIVAARPLESSSREAYERLCVTRERVRRGIALHSRILALRLRRAALDTAKASPVNSGAVKLGVNGTVGHDLAASVQAVLHAWKFPGLPSVSFDEASHDIRIDGKDRRSNGKGVRALMSAAFKIGVLIYCRERGLAHPGVIVLDSPLLSYRAPLSKYGALAEDEEVVQKSGLKEKFYDFLQDKGADSQFLILENDAPPELNNDAQIHIFAGPNSDGVREGFF